MKGSARLFIDGLSLMMDNGCTVRESLEYLASRTGSRATRQREAASAILASLGRGESLSAGFVEAGILRSARDRDCMIRFEQTGNALAALRVLLDDDQRRRDFADRCAQALIYPAVVLLFTFSALIFLLIAGIPLFEETGLLGDPGASGGMRDGVYAAALFLVISTASAIAGGTALFRTSERAASYWCMASDLAEAGLTYEECLALASSRQEQSTRTMRQTEEPVNAEAIPGLAGVPETLLEMTKYTGDYRTSFRRIAEYYRRDRERRYAIAGRLAEPVFMAITGITVCIAAFTVFLPLFNQFGGIT